MPDMPTAMDSFATARITSSIVTLDQILPRFRTNQEDIQSLLPWIFRQGDVATYTGIYDIWPENEHKFRDFFELYWFYRWMLGCLNVDTDLDCGEGVVNALVETQTVTLPADNRSIPESRKTSHVIQTQRDLLSYLLSDVQLNLGGVLNVKMGGYKLWGFGTNTHHAKYHVGGRKFRACNQGEISFLPHWPRLRGSVPIISSTGWFENQTWNEFLIETLTVMLGQLRMNNTKDMIVEDQEAFVVGFHGYHFHIARGFFPAETLKRVHAKGCSEDESLELQFTRGYNLFLKEDWLEATEGLVRLFRYLLSGSANVRITQRLFNKEARVLKRKR